MTWVIGRAVPFGYAVGISDIRVTLPDGKERDCLQKLYKIGSQMVLGFAGSVNIGFEIVNQISASLFVPEGKGAWHPQKIAELFPIGTKNLFKSFPDQQKSLGCELMLLAVDPTENEGPMPWAKCYAYRFFSPEFEPIQASNAEIVSIGSGASVKPYIEALHTLTDDYDMFKLDMGMTGGAGIGLMASVSSVLNKVSVPGISRHLHICIIERDRVRIGTNSIEIPEQPETNFIMPPVAKSREELSRLLLGAETAAIERIKC